VLVLPAMIVPDEQVEVYAKTSGYVSEITVDIGSRVRRGQTIIQLSVPELTDDLHHAEATLATKSAKANEAALLVDSAKSDEQRYVAEHELAEITLKRKTELFEGKAIPPQEFDVAKSGADLARAQVAVSRAKIAAAEGALQAARSDVVMAESDLARVKTLIDYTYVKSPFDGVVTHRGVDHGTFVRSAAQGGGAPLLTIDKTDVVRVVVDVPEADAPRVHVGTPVSIELRSAGGLPIDATITRSAQAIRADTRTMRTEIDLQNADGKLVPGIYAKVAIRLEAAPFKVAGGPP
jgi:multidrug resistance efflux pump